MNINDGRPLSSDDLSQSEIDTFAEEVTVYKDDSIWIVNKPSGLLSVPGRLLKDSLLNRLERADSRTKLIHRLDMDTSGLLVFGIGKEAQTHISKQFIERTTDKIYEAVVFGSVATESGTIDVPVRYEPELKPRHVADKEWKKHALTEYEVLAHELIQDKAVTRVKLKPITGRSHQLRVHMEYINHVIIGDPIYATGDAKAVLPRLALHAKTLTLTHPETNQAQTFTTAVPF